MEDPETEFGINLSLHVHLNSSIHHSGNGCVMKKTNCASQYSNLKTVMTPTPKNSII